MENQLHLQHSTSQFHASTSLQVPHSPVSKTRMFGPRKSRRRASISHIRQHHRQHHQCVVRTPRTELPRRSSSMGPSSSPPMLPVDRYILPTSSVPVLINTRESRCPTLQNPCSRRPSRQKKISTSLQDPITSRRTEPGASLLIQVCRLPTCKT